MSLLINRVAKDIEGIFKGGKNPEKESKQHNTTLCVLLAIQRGNPDVCNIIHQHSTYKKKVSNQKQVQLLQQKHVTGFVSGASEVLYNLEKLKYCRRSYWKGNYQISRNAGRWRHWKSRFCHFKFVCCFKSLDIGSQSRVETSRNWYCVLAKRGLDNNTMPCGVSRNRDLLEAFFLKVAAPTWRSRGEINQKQQFKFKFKF